MTSQLTISTEGHLGIVALNRPEAINALSVEMIAAITATLTLWSINAEVKAVLFEGLGPKGFCVGGDVRAMRDLALAGKPDAADTYFAAEYEMNGLIGLYPKPVIALSHGVVMGGGIGIAGHAAFRFTTSTARFAMPEAAIGFFCDVGVNWILGKAPLNRALLFLMSGEVVGAADALALGLADCAILPDRLSAVRASLVAAAGAGRVEDGIVGLMQAESIVPGTSLLCEAADLLPGIAWTTAGEFIAAVAATPGLETYAAILASRSPSSLAAIFASHLASRLLPALPAVLRLDLRLAGLMARQADMAEGVRALLVDKDKNPRWQPKTLAEVDLRRLTDVVAGR